MQNAESKTASIGIPRAWERRGLVIAKAPHGDRMRVAGDPCVVWDDEISTWRMALFMHPPGHGQSVCRKTDAEGVPVEWSPVESLDCVGGKAMEHHKPYIVQEANRPNRAARINGEYWLVTVAIRHPEGMPYQKYIRRARSGSLAGPWRWDPEPLFETGGPGEFDEKHADAVSGFYFPERDEVLYFYMGYPLRPQPRPISPWGNAQGLALQKAGEPAATKLGQFLPPAPRPGHWASGYLGGFQLLPGRDHRWIAMLNASPTAPDPNDRSVACEEPAPSLGGWAYCDEEWPVKGWHFSDQPLEWIDDVPKEAVANGEGTNLWRHHVLVLPDGRLALYYNSGYYGQEQLYMKLSAA